ncbi:MAG: amidohydrolase family protein [Pseudomonadota bacterium]
MAWQIPAPLSCASAILLLGAASGAAAQQTAVPLEGLRDGTPRLHALVNARIVVEPGKVIERGTVVVRDGMVVGATAGDAAPAGARRWDLGGRTVFAGFVEIAGSVGVPASMRPTPPPPMGGFGGPRQAAPPPPPEAGARHWNRRIRPERDVAEALEPKPDDAKALRALGFAAAVAAPDSGILRGQSALIALRDAIHPKDLVLAPRVFQHAALEAAMGVGGEYPGSTMGAIALLRQTLLDAQWQSDLLAAGGARERPESNLALDALQPLLDGSQRIVLDTADELDVGRMLQIAAEFGLRGVVEGNGSEYRVLPRLIASRAPVIVPLNFPPAPEIERPEAQLNTSLAELQHWEQAPANPGRLAAAGIEIALTTRGLKEPAKEFWPNLRKAVAAGLPEDAALRALTTTPAAWTGQSARLGRIAPGQIANLVVADAELFRAENASIYAVWVDGVRHELKPLAAVDPRGTWALSWSDARGPERVEISGDGPYDVKAREQSARATLVDNRLLLSAPSAWFGGAEGTQAVSLMLREDRVEGLRALEDGTTVAIGGRREGAVPAAAPLKPVAGIEVPAFIGYPAGEYGRTALPEQPKALLVRNATIWTMGPQGRIDGADLLVRAGKVVAVGKRLEVPPGATVVDAEGMHVTPGLVDAHSHTAISGNVNEPSHAVTTEVRIGDVVDPTDINIYRQLAGGVTTALQLHGSANPMGGQSETVKWRWGSDAEGLKFAGAKPGVKFALGENVKQANWGDAFTTRYPQSRLGVEQIMLDRFNAARDYIARWDAWNRDRRGPAPRRDLRLEALAEILRGERVVHIHSYRQDEILMFARLAKQYGFSVATFTHILEGYTVADALADIDAGASTFSDWWAFKMEVYDAIPHNAAILTRAGVLTSINSDSDEMARRLNAEAGKMRKYGRLDDEQALALVTINPARQLRVGDRVGSLEPGKDADFVIWNRHPLSSMARAEQTWIEGRRFFDRAEDARLQRAVVAERERLVEKILPERMKAAGAAGKPGSGPPPPSPGKDGPTGMEALLWGREVGTHTIGEWAVRYGHRRGLYHDGQDVQACSVGEHVH